MNQDSTPDAPFPPCPSSPNCVCSLAPPGDRRHRIEPFRHDGDEESARRRLLAAVRTLPRTVQVGDGERLLRFEVRSLLFRFVDDLAFYLPPGEPVVHVRSASRTGWSDMGVNRRRVEKLRRAFEAAD